MDRNGGQRPTWLLVTISSLRALLTASVLVALYYLMPFDLEGPTSSLVVKLTIGLIVFVGLMALAGTRDRDVGHPRPPGARGAVRRAPAVPARVRRDLLRDESGRRRDLHLRAVEDRRPLLHGDDLLDRRLRRHQRQDRRGPAPRHRAR